MSRFARVTNSFLNIFERAVRRALLPRPILFPLRTAGIITQPDDAFLGFICAHGGAFGFLHRAK